MATHTLPADHYLAHFVSPLELAACAAHFKAFIYRLDGINLPICQEVAAELLHIYHLRLRLCEQLTQTLRHLTLETGPDMPPFLRVRVDAVPMSTRLYHLLRSADCETMLDVAFIGRRDFARLRGVGPRYLEELRGLFIREGCIEWFD